MGCTCLSLGISSCTTAPITERRQLKLLPESKLNMQAAQIYEKVKRKEKLIKSGKEIENIKKNVKDKKEDNSNSIKVQDAEKVEKDMMNIKDKDNLNILL